MDLMRANQESWKNLAKVAWLRVGALGDLLVGMASLAEMHEFFPQAQVTVIGPKLWCEILSPEAYPWIECIAVIEKKAQVARLFRVREGRWQSTDEVISLRDLLRSYQAFVNTHIDSYRYGFTAWQARVPVRIGSTPAAMAWLYTHTSPFFGKDPLIHERDAALLLLNYAEGSGVRFFRSVERNRVNLSEWVERSSLVQKWRQIGLPRGKTPDLARAQALTGREAASYVLVNPTSSRREKAWPSSQFRELLLRESESFAARGLEILVLGAPNETDWLQEVAGSEFRIIQPTNIFDLQDVLSGARRLLTNTSSVQFIAAMTQTRTLTLMGRGRPEIWGPLGPHDEVLRGQPPPELLGDIFKQEEAAYRSIEVATVAEAWARF